MGRASLYMALKRVPPPPRGDNLYSVSSAEEAQKLIDDFETRNTINFPPTRQAKALEAKVRSSYIIIVIDLTTSFVDLVI